jgi:hypothetical protein
MGTLMVRSVRILVDAKMTPDEIGKLVAEKARASVADLVERGIVPPTYATFVDGREGAPEEQVNLKGGMIEYAFERIAEAGAYAYQFCRQLSPYGGRADPHAGAFFKAWLIIVDGLVATLADIDPDAAQIIIVNPAPYSRRLEQTIGKVRPAYHITEAAASATRRRFPSLEVNRDFVDLPGPSTADWPVPYMRKHDPREAMLYPAVVIKQSERR